MESKLIVVINIWICHVLRVDNSRICTTALMWQSDDKRKVGRPETTWRKMVERERGNLGIIS
jgi:hypothetical protein